MIRARMTITTYKGRVVTKKYGYRNEDRLLDHARATYNLPDVLAVEVVGLKAGTRFFDQSKKPPDAPSAHDYRYHCTTGLTRDEARAKFLERFGREPDFIWIEDGMVWAGPIDRV